MLKKAPEHFGDPGPRKLLGSRHYLACAVVMVIAPVVIWIRLQSPTDLLAARTRLILWLPCSDRTKCDSLREWANTVNTFQRPDEVFSVVPSARAVASKRGVVREVRLSRAPVYVWSDHQIAGVTTRHPSGWDLFGADESLDVVRP